jgi:hypothetical protein
MTTAAPLSRWLPDGFVDDFIRPMVARREDTGGDHARQAPADLSLFFASKSAVELAPSRDGEPAPRHPRHKLRPCAVSPDKLLVRFTSAVHLWCTPNFILHLITANVQAIFHCVPANGKKMKQSVETGAIHQDDADDSSTLPLT